MTTKGKMIGIVILSILVIILLFIATSFHALRLQFGVWKLNRRPANQEILNGVKPRFGYLPSPWVSPMMKQQMNQIWEPLNLKGMNYFTFAGPKNIFAKFVERMNPYSPYYQAWFGVYIIKAPQERFGFDQDEMDVKELGKLAVYDQNAWLKATGDPNPLVRGEHYEKAGKIRVGGTERTLYEGTMTSHADISENKELLLVRFLGVPSKSVWERDLTPYHVVTLEGIYSGWYSRDYEVTIVFYGCGSIFQVSSGKTYNHFEKIKDELLRMAEGIEFVPVKKKIKR